ncbi:SDR family oxidoreductase [Saccharopolyspora phatthalungensis]|uniref:Enoyl-[acyl-carrier protein] reductase III n=1 Tax=Saccharopolyspora phatthalungensis TaxID=664693 RepID=A0A840QHI8_9PSEU|nr:SDR family oxidoreductase [Saccharopolyspora phatthalungensis]MBB5158015.1 enoyl-[acyl-carrier protein] reductase III [Saccharopolyspora phatthalungensis]
MTDRLGLDGRTVFVTGASRGLGRAIARKMCASGGTVYLNYSRSEVAAKDALNELEPLPGNAIAVKGDVSEPDEFRRLLDQVRDRSGRLDVFVHNAATFRPMSAISPDPAAFLAEQALALNPLLHGIGQLTELVAADGRIVVISSNGAAKVIPGYVAVGVAKAALENLARYLAAELAGRGIAVNVIATALLDKGDEGSKVDEDLRRMLAARTPAGRLTRPSDVADAVALLCAPEAHWIHGQVLTVDGGLGLRA